MTVFKGNLSDCLKHFAAAFGKNRDEVEALTSFCDVKYLTTVRWLKGVSPPVGLPLVRLYYYLESSGYIVEELGRLNPVVRDVGRVFAFGLRSIDTIVSSAGYTEGRAGVDTMLRVFRGLNDVPSARLEKLKTFAACHGAEVLLKQAEFTTAKASRNKREMEGITSKERVSLPRPNGVHSIGQRAAIIESLAGSIVALLPLAQAVESDEFTAEDRARLRALSNVNGVFKLANSLYRLCGERARYMHRPSNEQRAERKGGRS